MAARRLVALPERRQLALKRQLPRHRYLVAIIITSSELGNQQLKAQAVGQICPAVRSALPVPVLAPLLGVRLARFPASATVQRGPAGRMPSRRVPGRAPESLGPGDSPNGAAAEFFPSEWTPQPCSNKVTHRLRHRLLRFTNFPPLRERPEAAGTPGTRLAQAMVRSIAIEEKS